MKSFIRLTALALGLALSATTHAETYIRITGSTAFRAAMMTGLRNTIDMTRNTGTFSNASILDGYGYNGTSFTGSTFAILRGLIKINGTTTNNHVTVKCNWSGSTQGIKDTVQGNSIRFLTDDVTGTNTNVAPTVALNNTTGTTGLATPTNTQVPNVTMADNAQGETSYNSVTLTKAANGLSGNGAIPGCVGAIAFAWIASNGSPAGLTNVTPQMLQQLFKAGFLDASVMTGNKNDATVNPNGTTNAAGTMVFAMGRNPNSGTHLNAFAESGLGIRSTASQFYAYNSGGATAWVAPGTNLLTSPWDVTNLNVTPLDASVGALNDGENGFDSGGTLATQMRLNYANVTDDINGYSGKACVVTYMGEGDAVSAVFGTNTAYGTTTTVTGGNSGNARFLTYNGVAGWGGHPLVTTTLPTVDGLNHVTLGGSDVTTGLLPGQLVKNNGANIPAPAYIVSVDSATTLTIGFWPNPDSPYATPTTVAGTLGSQLSISSLLPEALRNGSYSFWGYGYLLHNITGDATASGFIDAVCKQIATTDYFVSGFSQKYLRVKRDGAGKPIYQSF